MSDESRGLLRRHSRDPWRDAPVGELNEPLLPRWFTILAVAVVPVAVVVTVLAFLMADRGLLPVAERRPPGDATMTHAVGDLVVGGTEPAALGAPCARLQGLRFAGDEADREVLAEGLAELCRPSLPDTVKDAVRAFAEGGNVVRFAVFERTGVDSTRIDGEDRSTVLLNAKYSRTEPRWLAPLVVHELTHRQTPVEARDELAARAAEHRVCRTLAPVSRLDSPGCRDAAELLDLPDPLEALRGAGYR
jgi:hypothetical protein